MNDKMLESAAKFGMQADNYKKILRFYADEISYEYHYKYSPTPDVMSDRGERSKKILDSTKKHNLDTGFFRKIFDMDEYEEVLEFYAHPNHYRHAKFEETEVMKDNGERARTILNKNS